MVEKLDERPRPGDVASERADGFRQRPDLNIDAAVQSEVVDRSAAFSAEHAARMRIVHHHDAAELVGQIAESRQCAEIAVHAEDAVGDQQRALSARQLFENAACRVDVAVRKHLDGRATETRAVDDAGVIELVRNDRSRLWSGSTTTVPALAAKPL